MKLVSSFDAVSAELIEYMRGKYPRLRDVKSLVFPSSAVSATMIVSDSAKRSHAQDDKKRIAFCGSSRNSDDEWRRFLMLLERLPWSFEIIVFADPDYFNKRPVPPGNVSIRYMKYVDTEEQLVGVIESSGVHACYLGLWKDEKHRLFVRTSLSSKLLTYCSSGVPIIADVPQDSVAWRLVEKYHAGILVGMDIDKDIIQLKHLFGDAVEWRRMADGSSSLARTEFNLEKNVERFRLLLADTVGMASSGGLAVNNG